MMGRQVEKGVIYNTHYKVIELLNRIIDRMHKKSYNDFILLMARGDVIPELKDINIERYVTDYQMDNYYDETREKFYVEYMQKRYRREGFDYTGEFGFFDLNVELMIYSHIWESHYMLKTLTHISDLLSGKPYNWELRIPFNNNRNFIKERIIAPLIEVDDEFAVFLKEVYSPNLRNGFAHSMYNIDFETKKITLHNLNFDPDDSVQTMISFEDFQKKFLFSIQLSYSIMKMLEEKRVDIANSSKGNAITEVFELPNKRLIQIYADSREIRGKNYPVFWAVLIKEVVNKFNLGDWVYFEGLKTPFEVEEVSYKESEQYVKLKGANKKCISKMLTLAKEPESVDISCHDYELMRLLLK